MNTGTSGLGNPSNYEIRLSPRAKRDLGGLSSTDFRRVDGRINALAQNPRPYGVQKLWKQSHRIRVGPWRIIYLIDDDEHIVLVERVRRRDKDTYR